MDLTVRTFFDYYIFHPLNAPSQRDRVVSLVATVALGIFSFGIVHLICAVKLQHRNIEQKSEKNEQEVKVSEVFENHVNQQEAKTSKEEESDKPAVPPRNVVKLNGVELDVELTLQGADEGDDVLQMVAGLLYLYGKGVEQSNEKGIHYLQSASAKGNAEAMFKMGKYHQFGKYLKQSDELAAVWYRGAALAGHAESQWRLGALYHRGVGLKQSYEDAAEWYAKAAEQDHLAAINNLASLYYEGVGVEQSITKAVDLLLRARELGSEVAARNLELIGEESAGI